MGLESLSRGAFSCVFIEKDYLAFDLLNQNVDKLGERERVFCWRTDVVMTSFRPKYCEDWLPYEVVFFDPPYKMVKSVQPGTMFFKALQRLGKDTVTAPDAIVLFRTPRYSEFELPDCWRVKRVLQYSTMDIHWLVKNVPTDGDEHAAVPASEIIDETALDENEELSDDGELEDIVDSAHETEALGDDGSIVAETPQ